MHMKSEGGGGGGLVQIVKQNVRPIRVALEDTDIIDKVIRTSASIKMWGYYLF